MSNKTDSTWDDFDNTPAASLDSPPADDGYYKVQVRQIIKEGRNPDNALYALVVTEPAAAAGHTIITNLNNPDAYPNAAQLLLSKWKSFLLSSNRKVEDFRKCKTFEDRTKFFDGATAHIYFRPAVLVKNSNGYPATDFVTSEKFTASVGTNGTLMRSYARTGGGSGGAAAGDSGKKASFDDL